MNSRLIKSVLSKCAFNPKKPGSIKPIVDTNKFDYYCDRAREMIYTSGFSENPEEHLTSAIRVLVLAILKTREKTCVAQETPKEN